MEQPPIVVAGITINTNLLSPDEIDSVEKQIYIDNKRVRTIALIMQSLTLLRKIYLLTNGADSRNTVLGLIAEATSYLRKYRSTEISISRLNKAEHVTELRLSKLKYAYGELKRQRGGGEED